MTYPNEVQIPITTKSLHSSCLVLSEMLLLLPRDNLPSDFDVLDVILCSPRLLGDSCSS